MSNTIIKQEMTVKFTAITEMDKEQFEEYRKSLPVEEGIKLCKEDWKGIIMEVATSQESDIEVVFDELSARVLVDGEEVYNDGE